MKKIASLLCAALIAAAAIIPASASADKWTAGNGFLVNDANSAVTVTETDTGIQVSHGGYYTDGINWGGIAYNEKIDLDGFSVEITIDKLPNTGTDTWMSVGFMSQPQLFQVGNNYANNKGIANLIRWMDGYVDNYGPNGWSSCGKDTNDAFKLKEGDVLTVSVAKKDGKYVLTFNGIESSVAYDLSGIADDGKAYLVIGASMKDSDAENCFTYTINKINGKAVVEAKKPEAAAQTADAGIAVAALCLASAAGIIVFSKKANRA